MSAVFTPFRSVIALITSVVPCARNCTSLSATPLFARTSRTPRSKSGGVVSVFAVTISCRPVAGSVEKATRSVNVPPTSVATRRPAAISADPVVQRARHRPGHEIVELAAQRGANRRVEPGLVPRRTRPARVHDERAPLLRAEELTALEPRHLRR